MASGAEVRHAAWSHGRDLGPGRSAPDGRLVASGDTDGLIKLWEAATGRLLRTLGPAPRGVSFLAFHPDGRELATGVGRPTTFAPERTGTCLFWDVATGKEIRRLEGHAGGIDGIAFRPDGAQLATSSYDGTASALGREDPAGGAHSSRPYPVRHQRGL